jgi:hypothetical protein
MFIKTIIIIVVVAAAAAFGYGYYLENFAGNPDKFGEIKETVGSIINSGIQKIQEFFKYPPPKKPGRKQSSAESPDTFLLTDQDLPEDLLGYPPNDHPEQSERLVKKPEIIRLPPRTQHITGPQPNINDDGSGVTTTQAIIIIKVLKGAKNQ